jgi:beta-xylosidase
MTLEELEQELAAAEAALMQAKLDATQHVALYQGAVNHLQAWIDRVKAQSSEPIALQEARRDAS